MIDIGLHEVVRILLEEVIDRVVGAVLVILIVRDQHRVLLSDMICFLNVEEGLDTVGDKVLGVENVI